MVSENPLLFPPVMTLGECARALKIPLPNLHKFLKTRELPSYTIGRRRYVTAKGAIDFIEARERATTAE